MIATTPRIARADMQRCALCVSPPCDAACGRLAPSRLLRGICTLLVVELLLLLGGAVGRADIELLSEALLHLRGKPGVCLRRVRLKKHIGILVIHYIGDMILGQAVSIVHEHKAVVQLGAVCRKLCDSHAAYRRAVSLLKRFSHHVRRDILYRTHSREKHIGIVFEYKSPTRSHYRRERTNDDSFLFHLLSVPFFVCFFFIFFCVSYRSPRFIPEDTAER